MSEPIDWAGDKTGRPAARELEELRRAVAAILGTDLETWPTHGNAPLAIASAFAIRYGRVDELAARIAALEAENAALSEAVRE